MTLSVNYVPLAHAAQTWPLVEGHILEAIPYGDGDHTIDQVKALVCMGTWLLIVAVDKDNKVHGAATVSFVNSSNHRIAYITYFGGKLITGDATFKQMCEILKANGATKIQGMSRPSAARLWKRYGFNERTTLVEYKL